MNEDKKFWYHWTYILFCFYTVKFNKYIKRSSIIDYIQSVHLKITIYMTNIKST